MSWIDIELAKWRYGHKRPYQVNVEWTEFRELIPLRWYLGYGDEHLTAEELGATIDDCVVEFTGRLHLCFVQEQIGIDDFKWFLNEVEKGVLEDTELKAFKLTLHDAELRLTSEVYVDLIKRHALGCGMSAPTIDDGCQFARVFLARFMRQEEFDVDWDIREYSRFSADHWWRNPYAIDHRVLIQNSLFSAEDWDTLMLICSDAAKKRRMLPPSILYWYLLASHGNLNRPDEGLVPRKRPDKFGVKLRNNEFRHAVKLLEQVGMPWNVACKAMAIEMHYAEPTIRRICRKPYTSLEELRRDGQKRFEPALYSLMYGPDSDSDPTE